MTKKLALPSVTLFAIDTICHDLTRLAIEDSLEKVDFGDVVIFSDKNIKVPGARWVQCSSFPDRAAIASLMSEVYKYFTTSHNMWMHWDAGIVAPECWRPDFLAYDYIGAPWWYADGLNVGCASPAIRTQRLLEYLSTHSEFLNIGALSDDPICRQYRRQLERAGGFVWAPDETALDFSFERVRRTMTSRHFSFHGVFNWPFVYSGDDFSRRVSLARANSYVRDRGMITELDTICTARASAQSRGQDIFPWAKPKWRSPSLGEGRDVR